jgi:peptide/nickel transport system permease protein
MAAAGGSMRRYLGKKVLAAFGTLVFVLLFNFVLFRVMPGNPVDALARGAHLTRGQRQTLIHQLGLDKPIVAQLPPYVWSTLHGNLGYSYTSGLSVTETVGQRLWATILLVLPATILSVTIGIALGIRAGWRRGSRTDVGTTGVSLVFYSIPEGWLAMVLLLVFGSMLGIFPLGGYESTQSLSGAAHFSDLLSHLFLPVLTLTLAYMGEYVLVMRSSLVDVLGEEFLTTAYAKGLKDRDVRRHHAVPNALLPIATLVFYSFGFIIGGDVIVEAVFSWPGLGLLTYQAIGQLDYPVIEAIFLLASTAVIVVNLAADLSYAYLDPRVRGG